MNKIDIVNSFYDTSDPNRYDVLSDDLQVTDELGTPPMDKNTFIGMGHMIEGSFPDIQYVVEDIGEEGDRVKVIGHFEGTFSNDLDLSAMGMGVVAASGKKIIWPSGGSLVTVEGGKITRYHGTATGPDAGLPGFLKVIGVG